MRWVEGYGTRWGFSFHSSALHSVHIEHLDKCYSVYLDLIQSIVIYYNVFTVPYHYDLV